MRRLMILTLMMLTAPLAAACASEPEGDTVVALQVQALHGVWFIQEDPNGDGTSDVRSFNLQDNPTTTVINGITTGTFLIGPSFASELIAAGVTEGIAWTPTQVFFDPQRVPSGVSRNTLYAVVAAHDPTQPAPPDPFASGAADLANTAELLLLDPPAITNTQCVDYLNDYLTWYELFP